MGHSPSNLLDPSDLDVDTPSTPTAPVLSISFGALFTRTVGWFLLCTVIWMQVSAWTSYPVAQLTRFMLHIGADYWVEKVHVTPGLIEADTRIEVLVPKASGRNGKGDLIAQADPAHYGYGLPLLVALLIASRSPHLIKRAVQGYAFLLLPQTFSLTLEILRQIMVAGGSTRALVVDQWQMEAIALGYQFGSLILPPLAPVVLWLWLERDGFASAMWNGLINAKRQPS